MMNHDFRSNSSLDTHFPCKFAWQKFFLPRKYVQKKKPAFNSEGGNIVDRYTKLFVASNVKLKIKDTYICKDIN